MKRVILNIGNLPALVLTLATVLALFCLTSSYSYAEVVTVNGTNGTATASANASVNVSAACSFTSLLNTAHTATIAPGTYSGASGSEYANGIGKTTFTVICNDSGGYSIYAIGYANEEFGNNKLLATVNGSLAPTYDIVTGTATSGDTSNWAMKLTAVSGTYAPNILDNYNNYHNVPSTYAKVVTFASATDGSVGSKMEATYGAYISGTQPAGTYNGKVKYTMVHPATEPAPFVPKAEETDSGKICYYPNFNATTENGTMGCQNVAASVTLLASNFSREGYGFAGWSDAYDYETNTSAHFYGPQETITLTPADYKSPNKGLSLYAVWVKSAGNIQSWSGCSSLTPANTATNILQQSITALTDQRDNNTYAVAKLADGNCWMIENLRLDNTGTDNTNGSLAQGYGTSTTYGNFSGLADAESANFYKTATANSLYYSGTQSGTASVNIGTSNYPDYRMPRYNNLNTANRATNPTSNTFSNNNTTGGMYSYGNYYTWHAAIADLTYNGTNNQSTAGTSLCPTGWRLPQGGDKTRIASNDDNDFWNLTVDALNGGVKPANYSSNTRPYYTGTTEAGPVANKLRSYPNNFLYSGYFHTSSANNRGSSGQYWSSTALDTSLKYNLSLGSLSVGPGTAYDNPYVGRSIRCIAGS